MWPFKTKQGKVPEKTPKETCRQCMFFREYITPTKLLPDKTVIHGEVDRWECVRGTFVLNDLIPCELFEYNGRWEKRISLPHTKPPPPKSVSSVQRPKA